MRVVFGTPLLLFAEISDKLESGNGDVEGNDED